MNQPPGTRAAIYARFSTAHQRATSIEDQQRAARSACEARGWVVVEEAADAATSGADHARAGLDRLLDALSARRRPFEVLVIDDISRLSRDAVHGIPLVFGRLQDAGVAVHDVSTGETSDAAGARFAFMSRFLAADHQRQTIRRATTRALRRRVEDGGSPGGRRFGYQSESDPSGTGMRFKVAADEAAVVQSIFEWFAAGASIREIARRLTKAGVAPPRELPGARRSWSPASVRNMLGSRVYLGEVHWGGGSRVRPEGPAPVVHSAERLRIVPDELWTRVERRLNADHAKRGRPTGTGSRGGCLLGVAKCGACGGAMSTIGRKPRLGARLGCSARARKGADACPGVRTIAEAKLVPALAQEVRGALRGTDLPIESMIEAELDAGTRRSTSDVRAARRRLDDLVRRERRRVDALAACGDEDEAARRAIKRDLADLAEMVTLAQRALEEAEKTQALRPSPTGDPLDRLEASLFDDPGRGREVLRLAFGKLVVSSAEGAVRVRGTGLLPFDRTFPVRGAGTASRRCGSPERGASGPPADARERAPVGDRTGADAVARATTQVCTESPLDTEFACRETAGDGRGRGSAECLSRDKPQIEAGPRPARTSRAKPARSRTVSPAEAELSQLETSSKPSKHRTP